ncbi:MAG: transporter, partial [Spirochaetales bacterium]|nr:transporter [Spirochaetales bacterium]
LGIILGPSADISFRQALMQGQGSLIPLLGRPVGLVLMVAIAWILIAGVRASRKPVGVENGSTGAVQ